MLLVPMLPVAVALFELAVTACYLGAVARGDTRPSRTTWIIWALLSWLIVASSVEAGAGATLVKLVASALGATVIAAVALRRGTGGRGRLDVACFALAGVGVALWSMLDDPALGLALLMAARIAGAVPTLRCAWRDPRREAPAPWLLGLAGSAVNLALVDPAAWEAGVDGFAIWGFPVYLIAINASVLALTARHRRSAVASLMPRSAYAPAAVVVP